MQFKGIQKHLKAFKDINKTRIRHNLIMSYSLKQQKYFYILFVFPGISIVFNI